MTARRIVVYGDNVYHILQITGLKGQGKD